MAWCPHCSQDRPIQRQIFQGKCPHCGVASNATHNPACRAPVPGAVDVCTFCNTTIFAKATSEEEFQNMALAESQIKKPSCFVVTATLNNTAHPILEDMYWFRDEILIPNAFGRKFVAKYYIYGPIVAEKIKNSAFRRNLSYIFAVYPAYMAVKLIKLFSRKDKSDSQD